MSWIGDLMAALGSAGSSALDEASLVGRGMVEETRDPLNINRFDVSTRPEHVIESTQNGGYKDPKAGSDYEDEVLYNLFSMIDAPTRAVDRASKYYSGDELFADRPYLDDNRAMSGQASRPDMEEDPISEIARLKVKTEGELSGQPQDELQRRHMLNMDNFSKNRSAQEQATRQMSEDSLSDLQGDSSPGTESYTAIGDNILGDRPMERGSFTHLQRPVVEQEQIRRLGQLGVPRQAAEAVVDSNNSGSAQKAIADLTSRQVMSKQDSIQQVLTSYQTAIAKAQNPQQVQSALVMQLRNIGLSDPAIKMMLMSLGVS